MMRMTTEELTRIFRSAYGKYEQEHEARHDTWWEQDAEAAGICAVADAAERRVLDRLEQWLNSNDTVLEIILNGAWAVSGKIGEMREELDRGDG